MSPFWHSKKTLSIERCAFSMMLGATAGEEHDEPLVRMVTARSALSAQRVRRELFFLRCFAVSAGAALAIKDADARQKVLQSFVILLHALAPQGQSGLSAVEFLGEGKLIYTVLMMRHMKLLEEFRQVDPRQYELIEKEGASRFGTRDLASKNDTYRRALAARNVQGVGSQFAIECEAPGDGLVLEIGLVELQRYLTAMQEQLKSVKLKEQE